MITIEKFESLARKFGTIEFEGEKYWLTEEAEHGNSLLPHTHNYRNPDDDGNYWFDMIAYAIDEDGNEYQVTWIFNTEKDEDGNSKELDEYDYDDVDSVEAV